MVRVSGCSLDNVSVAMVYRRLRDRGQRIMREEGASEYIEEIGEGQKRRRRGQRDESSRVQIWRRRGAFVEDSLVQTSMNKNSPVGAYYI